MPVKIAQPSPFAYTYPLLIKNLIKTPLAVAPHQKIIYRDKLEYDYITFEKRICRLANALKQLGVQEGDTVAVMDWDSHRYLECFFAIPMIGAVLHTINIRLSIEQLIYTINHAEDDVILVNTDFLPMLEKIKDQLTTVKKIVLLTDADRIPEMQLVYDAEYEHMLMHGNDTYEFPDFDENAVATTFYTTGTTGMPKGVYFSHRQLVLHTFGLMSALCAVRSQIHVDSGDVYMPLTPMFHVHAWGMPYLCTLLGTKQIYPGRYEPQMILNLITTHNVTFSHCVPTILHMLLASPHINDADVKGWQVIIGGSAMPRGLCKRALDLGINVTSAYGMSETCPILTVANIKPSMMSLDEEKQIEIRCRTGLPAALVDLEIIDPDGIPVPHDGKSTGEVVVRTPWLTQGYLKDSEKSDRLWTNRWLHTGDIGFIDSENYLQITDRLKDVIKTGGEWISSLQIEDIISQHEAVSEVAVIGIPDEKWGERPMALVVLKESFKDTVEEKELKAFFMKFIENGTIPKFGMPSTFAIVDSISKTSVGKINKKQLRQNFRG